MEDHESFDPFLPVPGELVEYLSSFLWINDAVNFRRTCKRHAELAKSTVDKKIQEETKAHIFRWLKNPPCKAFPQEIWTMASFRYGPHGDRSLPSGPVGVTMTQTAEYLCMNEGLDQAFTAEDLEAAEFFWERGADLSYGAYVNSITNPTRLRKFVEYPLNRGYQGSLDRIMHAAVSMKDVLLIRRCISLGARDFDITKYSKVDKNFKTRNCSKCGSPGHYKSVCR